MYDITLYSMPGCGMCAALSMMLQNKHITYKHVNDAELCAAQGFTNLPVLVIGDRHLTFKEAIEWLNQQKAGDPV